VTLLRVHELCVRYGAREVVRGLSLELKRGERLGLVGPSGCGKSTALRAMLGLERQVTGIVTFDGQPITTRAVRRRIQPVFQDSLGALDPRFTIAEALAEPFILHGLTHGAAVIAELLELVQLPQSLGARRPRELSAGQRQRVGLARALALKPEALLLDEPVSALDVSVQAQIVAMLERLVQERGLTILLVSHDRPVVDHLCTRVLAMREGRLVSEGA
jgi:ABC-type dipeptide/oligopeptide/nickel transport system ATPase subunit